MPLPTSPVIRRARLGAELRQLRRREALTLEQVCDRLGWHVRGPAARRCHDMASLVVGGRPLPDIADHVVKPVVVRPEATDRRRAGIAVLLGVVDGKDALPAIGDRLAVLIEGVAPILAAFAAASRNGAGSSIDSAVPEPSVTG